MLKEYATKKKLEDLTHPSDLAMQKFIEDFSLFIKQCYHIVWSVEKKQKVKIQMLQEQKTEK